MRCNGEKNSNDDISFSYITMSMIIFVSIVVAKIYLKKN